MQYPALLPNTTKCINFASNGAYSPFFDIVWSFDYAIVGGQNVEGGFTVFLMENIPLVGGNPGIDLGYSGLSSSSLPYSINRGISGAILGVGFDSTGLFATSATVGSYVVRDGINENNVIPNSVTIRGGAPSYSFEEYNFVKPISSLIDTPFSVVESNNIVKYKTIRARLGNLGRTFYVDYRNNPKEYFKNIITHDVTLYPSVTSLYRVGVSFATPIETVARKAIGNIYLKNFHVEGTSNDNLYTGCADNCEVIDPSAVCDVDLGILPADYRCLTFRCISASPICDTEPCINTVPDVINFETANIEIRESADVFCYLSEGNTVGVDTCNLTTCVNVATGVDLFNFGYKLSVIELDKVLERNGAFSYKDSTNTVFATLTAIGDSWKIKTGTSTYSSNSAIPVGIYTGPTPLNVIYVQ